MKPLQALSAFVLAAHAAAALSFGGTPMVVERESIGLQDIVGPHHMLHREWAQK